MDKGSTASVLMSRRRLIQAGMVVAPAIMATQAARAAAGPERLREEARPLPAFTFLDAEGQEKTVSDFAGQGLVLNLWATWCAPCVAEMPALEKMAAALAGERIAVLPLSSDRGGKPGSGRLLPARGADGTGRLARPARRGGAGAGRARGCPRR